MKKFFSTILSGVALMALLGMLTGCETSDHGGSVSANYYYGSGYYDPWYYGHYYHDGDVIVVPPPIDRPDGPPDNGLRPTHPIVIPPAHVAPAPRPSIPSAPRPAFRGGSGGGRR